VKGFASRLFALYRLAGFPGSPFELVLLGNIKQPQNYAE